MGGSVYIDAEMDAKRKLEREESRTQRTALYRQTVHTVHTKKRVHLVVGVTDYDSKKPRAACDSSLTGGWQNEINATLQEGLPENLKPFCERCISAALKLNIPSAREWTALVHAHRILLKPEIEDLLAKIDDQELRDRLRRAIIRDRK